MVLMSNAVVHSLFVLTVIFATSRSKSMPEEELVWNVSSILRGGPDTLQYAMVILNAPIATNPDTIKSLWKSAVLRLTVDGGSNRWLQFIRSNDAEDLPVPDCITGDFDSISDEAKAYFEGKHVRFVATPDQNETDFTKALREINSYISRRNLPLRYVLALGTNTGRLDQVMANMETLHIATRILDNVPIILMTSNSLVWLLAAQRKHTIQVPEEFVGNSYAVGLIPLRGPTKATTSGLKWDLNNTQLGFGELVSTSNTFEKGTVEVRSDLDLIWSVQYEKEEI